MTKNYLQKQQWFLLMTFLSWKSLSNLFLIQNRNKNFTSTRLNEEHLNNSKTTSLVQVFILQSEGFVHKIKEGLST